MSFFISSSVRQDQNRMTDTFASIEHPLMPSLSWSSAHPFFMPIFFLLLSTLTDVCVFFCVRTTRPDQTSRGCWLSFLQLRLNVPLRIWKSGLSTNLLSLLDNKYEGEGDRMCNATVFRHRDLYSIRLSSAISHILFSSFHLDQNHKKSVPPEKGAVNILFCPRINTLSRQHEVKA